MHGFTGGGMTTVVEVDVDVGPGGRVVLVVVLVLVPVVLVVVDDELEVVELDVDVGRSVDVVVLDDVEVVLVEVDVDVLVVEVLVLEVLEVEDVVVGPVVLVLEDVVVGPVVLVLEVLVLEDVVVGAVELVDDEVLVVGAVVDVVVELGVIGAFTSGPVALQRDSARMTSKAGNPGRAVGGRSMTWTARTMMLVLPGVLLTICSLRMAVRTPGMVMTVLAAGDWSSGLPPRAAFTRLVEPVEPSPFEVQVLETAVAVRALAPTTTSATLAELVAKPAWLSPATFPPCVEAFSTPVLRMVGMEMGTELPETGP